MNGLNRTISELVADLDSMWDRFITSALGNPKTWVPEKDHFDNALREAYPRLREAAMRYEREKLAISPTEAASENLRDWCLRITLEHQLAVESLTEKQLIEAIQLAIKSGDFARVITSDGTRQGVIYIPGSEADRLRIKLDAAESLLLLIGCRREPDSPSGFELFSCDTCGWIRPEDGGSRDNRDWCNGSNCSGRMYWRPAKLREE